MPDDKYNNSLEYAAQLTTRAASVANTATVAPLASVAKEVDRLVGDWRAAGGPLVFRDLPELRSYHQHVAERVLVQLTGILDGVLGIVLQRLQNDDVQAEMDLHTLLRIAESMTTQVAGIRGALERPTTKADPPATAFVPPDATVVGEALSVEDIDAEIAQLRARAAALRAGPDDDA